MVFSCPHWQGGAEGRDKAGMVAGRLSNKALPQGAGSKEAGAGWQKNLTDKQTGKGASYGQPKNSDQRGGLGRCGRQLGKAEARMCCL